MVLMYSLCLTVHKPEWLASTMLIVWRAIKRVIFLFFIGYKYRISSYVNVEKASQREEFRARAASTCLRSGKMHSSGLPPVSPKRCFLTYYQLLFTASHRYQHVSSRNWQMLCGVRATLQAFDRCPNKKKRVAWMLRALPV